jgi:CHU_C Type IX secretion signal domain/PKD domain
MIRTKVFIILLLGSILLAGGSLRAQPPEVKFIENKCQWPEQVQFGASAQNAFFSLNPGGFGYTFIDQHEVNGVHQQDQEGEQESSHVPSSDILISGHQVTTTFLGANKSSRPVPFGKLSEYYNYFLGNDHDRWSSDVSAFEGVLYPQYYSGIDLKVYSQGENLKYEFIVEPGADPSQIVFRYAGADQVNLIEGNLVVRASQFSFIEKKPVVYQIIAGEMVYLQSEYELQGNTVRFCFLEEYDLCYPLIIDPILIFSTYSGSTADNWGSTATPGEHGTLYSAGVTNPSVLGGFFPVTTGSFQLAYGGGYDIGILKYDSAGSKLLYATYLGGSGAESPHSLVINKDNELLVLGTTGSSNFPTSQNAFDRTYNGGVFESNVITYSDGSDLFVAKISGDGKHLLASTLLGGSANDGLNRTTSPLVANYGDQLRGDIISDLDNNIYISTVTASADFPVVNSFGMTFLDGFTDALLIKLNSDLSQLLWAGFLGGTGIDASHTIKFDLDGNLVVAGGSSSVDFPTTAGVYQIAHAGSVDGWIAKIKNDGSSILASTFTGTPQFNQVYFIDLDSDGNIYAYGQTTGSFPTTPGVYKNTNSGQFLQKFDPTLSNLIFSTVFGSGIGVPNISPTAFLVNDCNNIYLSGWGGRINSELGFWQSSTAGMPTTADAFQKTTSGSDFYFMVLTNDASQLLYATFLGGTQSRTHVDGGTSRFDKSGIVYHAVCSGCAALNTTGVATSDFPTTAGAWSRLNKSLNCNNAAFKFDLSLLKARIQTNSVTLKQPGLNKVCLPDKIVFQNKSTGGQYYQWDFGDGNSLEKADTTRIVYQYLNAGVYKVKLKAIDLGTCLGVDSTATTISVFKATGFAGEDQTMCFNAGVQLTAGGGVQYTWSTSRAVVSTEATPVVNPESDTRYFISITDLNGCLKKDTLDVSVTPGIDLDFTYSKMYDCFGRTGLQVENLTVSDQQTFFDFGDGITSDLTVVSHEYDNDGVYPVRLVGVRESCVYEKKVDIPIYTLLVPNVITPDEFPENNFFHILYGGRPLSQSALKASLYVYNRWGGLVLKSNEYKDDWDAGNVESGVYFYELVIENEFICKGWVQVIK